jgi:sarcosine/dimethylglycine N-methyltransferase
MLQKDACSQRAPAALIPIGFFSTGIAPFAPYHKGIEEPSRENESPGAPCFGQVLFQTASALELPFDDGLFDVVLLQHVAMNISERARLYREIRRVLKPGGRFATFDVVSNGGEPHYPVPWARTAATSFLMTAAATREAIEPAGFRTLVWQDDTEAAKAWVAQLRASGPPPSPNLGVVMGPDFAQLAANLGRNLMEGRVGVLTAVLEASKCRQVLGRFAPRAP